MEYIKGTFIREHKTRFLCDVFLDGKKIECYMPSSCKLGRFVNLVDKEVILQPVTNEKARTKYSIYAVKFGRQYVMLNLSEVNCVVEDQLYRRFFSFLGKRKRVYREKVIDGYKADIYIEDTNTIVEVKTVLSFEKEGRFPSVFSNRAEQQLVKLSELLLKGYKVCYIVISLNPTVEIIRINEIYEQYYRLFQKCIDRGMMYRGFAIKLNCMKPEIDKKIDVVI